MKTRMKTKRAFCGLLSGLLLLAAGTAQTQAGVMFSANYNQGTNTTTYNFTGAQVSTSFTDFVHLKNFLIANLPGWGPSQVFARVAGVASDIGFNTNGNDLVLREYFAPFGPLGDNSGDYLLSNSAALNGGIFQITEGSSRSVTAGSYDIELQGAPGVAIGTYDVTVTPVPEPGTALFGFACVGIAALRRRRNA